MSSFLPTESFNAPEANGEARRRDLKGNSLDLLGRRYAETDQYGAILETISGLKKVLSKYRCFPAAFLIFAGLEDFGFAEWEMVCVYGDLFDCCSVQHFGFHEYDWVVCSYSG